VSAWDHEALDALRTRVERLEGVGAQVAELTRERNEVRRRVVELEKEVVRLEGERDEARANEDMIATMCVSEKDRTYAAERRARAAEAELTRLRARVEELEAELAHSREAADKYYVKARVYGAIACEFSKALQAFADRGEELAQATLAWRYGEKRGVPMTAVEHVGQLLDAESKLDSVRRILGTQEGETPEQAANRLFEEVVRLRDEVTAAEKRAVECSSCDEMLAEVERLRAAPAGVPPEVPRVTTESGGTDDYPWVCIGGKSVFQHSSSVAPDAVPQLQRWLDEHWPRVPDAAAGEVERKPCEQCERLADESSRYLRERDEARGERERLRECVDGLEGDVASALAVLDHAHKGSEDAHAYLGVVRNTLREALGSSEYSINGLLAMASSRLAATPTPLERAVVEAAEAYREAGWLTHGAQAIGHYSAVKLDEAIVALQAARRTKAEQAEPGAREGDGVAIPDDRRELPGSRSPAPAGAEGAGATPPAAAAAGDGDGVACLSRTNESGCGHDKGWHVAGGKCTIALCQCRGYVGREPTPLATPKAPAAGGEASVGLYVTQHAVAVAMQAAKAEALEAAAKECDAVHRQYPHSTIAQAAADACRLRIRSLATAGSCVVFPGSMCRCSLGTWGCDTVHAVAEVPGVRRG
jgi:hypothetical protein